MSLLLTRLKRIAAAIEAGPCDHKRDADPGETDEAILRRFFEHCPTCGWQPTFVDLVELATGNETPADRPPAGMEP